MSERYPSHAFVVFIFFSVFMVLLAPSTAWGVEADIRDRFESGLMRWESSGDGDPWIVRDGLLARSSGRKSDSVLFAKSISAKDAMVEARFRVGESGRRNVGVVLRARPNGGALMLRHYDHTRKLQLLVYEAGRARDAGAKSPPAELRPGVWYRMKAATIGDDFLGKLWSDGSEEPDWQLRARVGESHAGRVGLLVHDDTRAEFSEASIWTTSIDEELERLRVSRQRGLEKHLSVHIVPWEFPRTINGSNVRPVSVVLSRPQRPRGARRRTPS